MKIDINCDLGEGYGAWTMGDDEALLRVVTSANVACGFHAGDPSIMDRTVRLAQSAGADVGAHVSFPDLQGFGRRLMHLSAKELETLTLYQLGALSGIARPIGKAVTHVTFHGALGNLALVNRDVARALVAATKTFDADLILCIPPLSALQQEAERAGLRVAQLVLADRAYDDQGQLVPRGTPGAVIHDQIGRAHV